MVLTLKRESLDYKYIYSIQTHQVSSANCKYALGMCSLMEQPL